MPFIDINEIPTWERLPGWHGRLFDSEQISFAQWDFVAGSTIHEHHHPTEEVWTVIEGTLEMTVDGVTKQADPGTAAIVPHNALHSARAITDGRALVVDYPRREDQSNTD